MERGGGVDGGVVSSEDGKGISTGVGGVRVAVLSVCDVGESTAVSSSPSNSTSGESDGTDRSLGRKRTFCSMDMCHDSGQ